MQIAAGQLAQHLRQPLAPLYAVVGDEPLLQLEAVDALRAAARAQGYGERHSFTVSGAHFDWSAVLAAGGAMSLFAQRQLIEVHIPSGKPGKEGAPALQRLAQQLLGQADTLAVVVLPRLDKTSQATPWFQALSQGVVVNVLPVERAALPQWIAQRLAAQNQRVAAGVDGTQALQFFADRVEGNLLAAHQEVQKLALLYPPGELSLAHIQSAVGNVARYDVFKLSEAVLGGQVERTFRMLEGLQAEGESEVLVHHTLAEDVRALARAKQGLAAGQPLPVVLRELRVWGARERLFERVLPRLRPAQLAQWVQDAHGVDGICKGLTAPGWPTDPWQALQRLAFAVCRACAVGH